MRKHTLALSPILRSTVADEKESMVMLPGLLTDPKQGKSVFWVA